MSKAAEVAAAVAASPPEDPPSTGSGIYCYKCNSFKEPDCMSEETLNKKYIVECKDKDGQKSIGCWNIRQWVEYDQDSGKSAEIWLGNQKMIDWFGVVRQF